MQMPARLHCATVALALLTTACAAPVDQRPPNPLFLTQATVPTETMQALFVGRIVIDSAGCVRADAVDNATIVWPKGFSLADGRVQDATGRPIGTIGGEFRLGGGEIDVLPMNIAGDAALRARVLELCPGKFFLVGDVPD